MAMTKCEECGADVSTKAESCPKCGAPISPKKPVKEKKKTSLLTWLIVLLIGLSVLGSMLGESQEEKEAKYEQLQAERAAETNRKNIEYFTKNTKEILSSVKKEIDAGNYDKASEITGKYLTTNNKEILVYHKQARTKTVLKKLKAIPGKKYVKNRDLYKELVSLNPDNAKYKAKVKFYTKKQVDKEAKFKKAEARKKKIESSFSGWDGSHRGLEKYIKSTMNDPESYDHVETRYTDKGSYLYVQTTFRGRNGFGGMVKQTVSANVSLDGKVLKIF